MAIINKQNDHKNMFRDADGVTYRLPKPQETVTVGFTSLATTGNVIKDVKDHKTIYIAKNTASSEGTITFLKGDGFAGANNYEVKVPANAEVFFTLDSAKFMDKASGEIRFNASATTLQIAVLEVR